MKDHNEIMAMNTKVMVENKRPLLRKALPKNSMLVPMNDFNNCKKWYHV